MNVTSPTVAASAWGSSRCRSRPVVLALVVVSILTSAVATHSAGVAALFTHSASPGTASLGTGSCMLPRVRDVQRGTVSVTTGTPVDVALTSVDPTKAFLLFTTRHASNRPVGSLLRGTIASATSLQFTRVSNESEPMPSIDVDWSVIEYECGVRVQRGVITPVSATTDVALPTAVVPAQTFVTYSKTAPATSGTFGATETLVAELTSGTNLRLETSNPEGTVAWQVVEFLSSGSAVVHTGSTTLGPSDTSVVVTVPTVSLSRTFVLASHRSSVVTQPEIGARMIDARLSSSTSLTISRSTVGSGATIDEVHWQVVELLDGSVVHSGETAMSASQSSAAVALPVAVDLRRSAALASVQHGSGQNAGRGSYVSDDVVGEMSFTLDLTDASTLTVARARSSSEASVAWSVVEWGRASTSQDCGLPRVRDIQSGTTSSSTEGVVTVPIRGVAMDRAFLLFTNGNSAARPANVTVRGEIATATSLTFTQVTDGTNPPVINIAWTVVEYECGVRVQRGTTSQATATVNVAITPVAGLDRAFVTFSKTPQRTADNWADDDPTTVDLSSTSNLRIRTADAHASHLVAWQVIEFTIPGAISVQRGTIPIDGSSLSVSVPIQTVDRSRTMVLLSLWNASTGLAIGPRMVRGQLTDANTLVIERGTVGSGMVVDEVSWQVIELRDGSTVKTGQASFGSGTASTSTRKQDVTIAAVDLRRATPLATFSFAGGQSGGSTPYTGNDTPGEASWMAVLVDSTTLRLTRNRSSGTAVAQWQVVEWGQP